MMFSRLLDLIRPKVNQPEGLISVLNDLSAPFGDRGDAAMDLGAYDEALPTLVAIAGREGEDPDIVEDCGESIGDIWKRTGGFDRAIYLSLPADAQKMISGILDTEQ